MASFVTNNGLAEIVSVVVAANAARHLQWGTGSGQDAADNALADTTGTTEARTGGTMSAQTETTTGDTIQVVGTITAEGELTITEVGVFDTAGSGSPPTGGNMIAYNDFSAIDLMSADSITFTVKITLDQA